MNSTKHSIYRDHRQSVAFPVVILTWLLVFIQFVLPSNYAIAVVQDQYFGELLSEMPSLSKSKEKAVVHIAMVEPYHGAKVSTTVVASSFSDQPTDEEFFGNSIFPEPLVPIGATTTAENRDLAGALLKFKSRTAPDDVSSIVNFLETHPESPWRVALLTDLGLFYRQKGYFTRALNAWEQAWQIGKDANQPRVSPLVDRAVGELAELNARLGRRERLLKLLEEIKDRPTSGPATESIVGAREGLWGMDHKPGESFLCGPFAVARMFKELHPGKEIPNCLRTTRSSAQGTSLAQIYELAKESGLNARMAKRSPGAGVVVPSVIHWKAGHFAALMREKDGQYFVRDATFGTDIWVTKDAIDDEGSGYFLLPENSALPRGWSEVDLNTAKTIWGKGKANDGDKRETLSNSKKCAGDCPPVGGMAGYSVNALLVSLNIVDTPVSYTPPFGPPLAFTVNYNQREAGQSGNINYPNVGGKWSFSWLAYVTEITPNSSSSSAEYHTPGGGYETYDNPNTQGVYPIQARSRSKLQRTTDPVSGNTTGYQLTFVDGSTAFFSYADGAAMSQKWFMTKMQDPFGNAIDYNFTVSNSKIQLTSVQCATAKATLTYDTVDRYKIVQVSIATTSGGTRSANLAYSGGELVEITDAVGLTSRFSYDANITDFINALTTPYGRTTFSYVPYPGYVISPTNFDRWLVITDPLGQQKRLLYQVENTLMPKSETPTPLGMTIFSDPTEGQYLQYRNTFYWDRKAMESMPDPNNPDWTKAHIYHWLHLDDQTMEDETLVAAGVLESEKMPLERRTWYAYPGQMDNRFLPDLPSPITQPSKIARVLDDGQTQMYQYTYNDLGQPTTFTDPLGRMTTFVYDANNLIDLLEVRQTPPGSDPQLLAKFTYNVGHDPLTIQETSGQLTQLGYNSRGQVTQLTDAKGAVTTLSYDATSGFLQNVARPDVAGAGLTLAQRTTTVTPDSFFHPKTVMDGDGYIVTNSYDNLDRLIETAFPDGTTNRIVYQKLSPVAVKDRLGRWSAIEYDVLGRVALVRDAQQRTTRFDYCSCGDLASITDPNGATTTWLRDLQGRVTTKIFPDNSRVNYIYENYTSRLKSLTDALGQTTSYAYFKDNDLSSVAYTGGLVPTPTVSFTYNAVFNRLATMQDGVGLTSYTYKPVVSFAGSTPTTTELTAALGANRLQSVDGPLPNDTVTFSYDELGRVSNRSIGGIAQTVSYDALGRLIGVNNALDNFTYTYDSASARLKTASRTAGQIAALSYFSSSNAQNQQRLQTILNRTPSGTAISQFDYGYSADGEIGNWTRQMDGITGPTNFYAFSYDSVNQLLAATLKSGTPAGPGPLVKDFGYTYDGAGNRLTDYVTNSVNVSGSATTLSYNNLNELTKRSVGERVNFIGTATDTSTPVTVNVSGSPATMSGSGFNGYGIASSNSPVVPIVARDNAGNRATNRYWVTNLVVTGIAEVQAYDLNGNLVADASGGTTNTYEWDAANRMTAMERVTSGARVSRSEFTYDGLGRRVKIVEKDGSGTVTSTKHFVWCGLELCQERDVTGSTITKQFFPQGEVRSGTKYFYTRDHLGSIREVTDISGSVLARYDYDPYGFRTKISGSFDCDFGFTGHYFHAASGLCFALFRVYDPNTGRWLNRDPLAERGGVNLYEYVGNNPSLWVDIYGLIKWGGVFRATAGIIGNLLGLAGGIALGVGASWTGVGAVVGGVVAVKSGYGVGANVLNLINAFSDEEDSSKGSLLNDLAQEVAPCNKTAQNVASVLDLAIDLGGSRLAKAAKTASMVDRLGNTVLEGGSEIGPTFSETEDRWIEFLGGIQALSDSGDGLKEALGDDDD